MSATAFPEDGPTPEHGDIGLAVDAAFLEVFAADKDLSQHAAPLGWQIATKVLERGATETVVEAFKDWLDADGYVVIQQDHTGRIIGVNTYTAPAAALKAATELTLPEEGYTAAVHATRPLTDAEWAEWEESEAGQEDEAE